MSVIEWVTPALSLSAVLAAGYAVVLSRRSNRSGPVRPFEQVKSDYEPNEAVVEIYRSQCEQLQEGRQSAYEQFDKAVLALSAGALAVSVAFIKDIAPLPQATHIECLFGSWCLFGLSILLTLGSFIASQRAFDRRLEDAVNYYLDGDRSAMNRQHMSHTLTRLFNWCCAASFLIALLLTMVFAILNVQHQRQNVRAHMQEETQGKDPARTSGIQTPPAIGSGKPANAGGQKTSERKESQ